MLGSLSIIKKRCSPTFPLLVFSNVFCDGGKFLQANDFKKNDKKGGEMKVEQQSYRFLPMVENQNQKKKQVIM